MLSAGTRLGPYEIMGALGAGGMGEVYRARDTRLGRDVAVKILPRSAIEHPDARQRFEREARAISSLNHPHVCTLYDVGQQDDTSFLVMELLEGETLAARLEKGALATPELLRIGIEVADALEKAHRHGILHRDLKPLNIMLTKTGAKLMDFGLAKSAPAASSSVVAQSLAPPTRTTPLTAQGTIVGTFQYMSPEQLEGHEADVRSDIFSFGAVLYEMATGKRAFEGKTTASVIAAVLERNPAPISSVQPLSPPALERTVQTCLEKDPDARFQSAHDVKLQLEWIRQAGSETAASAPVAARRRNRERAAWTVAGLLAIIAAGFGYGAVTRAPAEAPAVIAQLSPPAGARFALWGVSPGAPVLSPDGTQIAFVAQAADGKQQLWVRRLDSPAAHAFEGTDGAALPFWSPDGRSIGYTNHGTLYRIDVSGGAPIPVAAVSGAFAATWNRAGVILFSSATNGMSTGIFRVQASGGASEPVKVGAFAEVGYPQFLPDGRHFLFTALGKSPQDDAGVYAASLDGGDPRLVLRTTTRAWYAAPGYLVFVRGGSLIATLMAQSFDADTLQLSGEPAPLAENVVVNPVSHSPILSVSDTGTLVYDPTTSSSNDRIVWYDRSGNPIGLTGTPGEFGSPSLSPDGKRLAISFSDGIGGKPDVWVYDLTRGVRTRVTSEAGISADAFWSPDNAHVCFVSNRGGPFRIYQKAADGTGAAAPVVLHDDDGAAEFFGSWSADGRYLVFQRPARTRVQSNSGPATGEIWAVQPFGDQKPFPVVQNGQFVAIRPALSPDATWLAYVSDESGQEEVYVVPFPHGTGKYLVSSGGGTWPRWSRDGKELFYWQGHSMMSVQMQETNGGLSVGNSERLFRADPAPGGLGPMYDVSADGKKFVVASRGEAETANPLTLVLNWPALLRRR